MNEFDELCNEAYENAKIYKAKIKTFHDKMISLNILNLIRRFSFLILILNYLLTSLGLDGMVLLYSNKCFPLGQFKFWIPMMVVFLLLLMVNV